MWWLWVCGVWRGVLVRQCRGWWCCVVVVGAWCVAWRLGTAVPWLWCCGVVVVGVWCVVRGLVCRCCGCGCGVVWWLCMRGVWRGGLVRRCRGVVWCSLVRVSAWYAGAAVVVLVLCGSCGCVVCGVAAWYASAVVGGVVWWLWVCGVWRGVLVRQCRGWWCCVVVVGAWCVAWRLGTAVPWLWCCGVVVVGVWCVVRGLVCRCCGCGCGVVWWLCMRGVWRSGLVRRCRGVVWCSLVRVSAWYAGAVVVVVVWCRGCRCVVCGVAAWYAGAVVGGVVWLRGVWHGSLVRRCCCGGVVVLWLWVCGVWCGLVRLCRGGWCCVVFVGVWCAVCRLGTPVLCACAVFGVTPWSLSLCSLLVV